MSKKIDLKNQSINGLYLLIDYCKKNKIKISEYLDVAKINKDWLKQNNKYIRINSLNNEEKRERQDFIKDINKK